MISVFKNFVQGIKSNIDEILILLAVLVILGTTYTLSVIVASYMLGVALFAFGLLIMIGNRDRGGGN